MNARASQRGLTLPELLIALFILALISGTAVYALRLAVDARDQIGEADAAIRDMQLARLIIKQDLSQAALRESRDDFGKLRNGVFRAGEGFLTPSADGETRLFGFVRRGWINPDDAAPRSTLQAVEYLLIDDRLVRRAHPYVDDARNQPRTDRTLISGVSTATAEYLAGETNAGLVWVDSWPTPQTPSAIPRALRLTIATDRFGELEQWFWVGEFAEP